MIVPFFVAILLASVSAKIDPRQGSECGCGQINSQNQNTTRIVGGEVANRNEIPWRTAMYKVNYLNPFAAIFGWYDFYCGASIISDRWIMTAAHCVDGTGPPPFYFGRRYPLRVVVGAHDLGDSSEKKIYYNVKREIVHPDYDSSTLDNDFALLELEKDITMSDTVAPVCLPFDQAMNDFTDTQVLASGWGTTRENGGGSGGELRKVILDVISNQQCQEYYGASRPPINITRNMICTYTYNTNDQEGKDTCQGDSGGSIDSLHGDHYEAVGVVSFGEGCAREKKPGVYSRVTQYLKFIEENTGMTTSYCPEEP